MKSTLTRDLIAEPDSYRVQPTEHGFAVWRFFDWTNDTPGWRIIIDNLRSREAARAQVLKRFGLEDEDAQPEPEPNRATVMWTIYG